MPIKWTDERPTDPGDYWLSLPPSERRSRHACLPVVINAHGDLMTEDLTSAHFRYAHMTNQNPDGAKWSRRETPADPFVKAESMRTDQDGREFNHDDREQKLNPDALVKKAIQHLRKRKPKNGRGYVFPLWKRVADLFGHGSGYSAEICRRHGFDPDEEWKPEQQCPDCKRLVNPEELRPAPCNYEQEVNGNDAPYVMCSQCRSERNDAI